VDDASDRGYSRAPELEDLLRLCQALNRAGAKYLLIGGFAVILHGFVRTTKDIDLLVDPSPDNVRALKQALASLPDNAAAEMTEDELQRYPVVRVADEVVVDLLAAACGITYEEAVAERQLLSAEGVAIPSVSKEMLIRTKATIRPSDASDVAFLRLRIAEDARTD
jgi:hypothetical protein